MELKNQWKGKINKANGGIFESELEMVFKSLKQKGLAIIEKTPEPMKIIKSLGNGRFEAFLEKKAQPDFKGVLEYGQAIMIEAKYTSTDRIEQSRVSPGQADYLSVCSEIGAYCFVAVRFSSGGIYLVPWETWKKMKQLFGRKYAKETDLECWELKLMLKSLFGGKE